MKVCISVSPSGSCKNLLARLKFDSTANKASWLVPRMLSTITAPFSRPIANCRCLCRTRSFWASQKQLVRVPQSLHLHTSLPSRPLNDCNLAPSVCLKQATTSGCWIREARAGNTWQKCLLRHQIAPGRDSCILGAIPPCYLFEHSSGCLLHPNVTDCACLCMSLHSGIHASYQASMLIATVKRAHVHI